MWLHVPEKKHRNEVIKLTNIHIRLSKASNDDKDDEVRFYHMFFAHKGKVKWQTGWFMTSHAVRSQLRVYRLSLASIYQAWIYSVCNFVCACAVKAHDRQLSLAPIYIRRKTYWRHNGVWGWNEGYIIIRHAPCMWYLKVGRRYACIQAI